MRSGLGVWGGGESKILQYYNCEEGVWGQVTKMITIDYKGAGGGGGVNEIKVKF